MNSPNPLKKCGEGLEPFSIPHSKRASPTAIPRQSVLIKGYVMLSGNVGGLTHESVHSVVESIELVPLLLVIQRVVLGFKFKQFAVKFGESIHMTYTRTHEPHQILLTGLLTLPTAVA